MDQTLSPHTHDPITVETTVVGCDGGGGPLGHPLVFLNLLPAGTAVCPYCSRRFVLAAGAGAAESH